MVFLGGASQSNSLHETVITTTTTTATMVNRKIIIYIIVPLTCLLLVVNIAEIKSSLLETRFAAYSQYYDGDMMGNSYFDEAHRYASFFTKPVSIRGSSSRPKVFDMNKYVEQWDRGTGGLNDNERTFLANLYISSNSVFEYGIGESTNIATYAQLPKYTGVDSDALWVDTARKGAPKHFQFYFADIGPTGAWGRPDDETAEKMKLRYQVAPLAAERYPFDVYLVDGRFRVGCALLAFLHASARGGDLTKISVCMHDYKREEYHFVENVANLYEQVSNLACFRRNPEVTDEEIFNFWKSKADDVGR